MTSKSFPIPYGDESIDVGIAASPSDSMSFVITEDIISALGEAANSNSSMSNSQFAQVIFHDVADAHSDRDLTCLYTLAGILTAAEDDKIGLFKLSTVSVNEHVTFKNVSTKSVDQGLKTFKVVFESTTLPSDGDFYQFRYLRGDQVFGASIPFQLKIPMSFATVEKDEFMMVEPEENAADSMLVKVEMLTSQNLDLQSQLLEATSIIATLKAKTQETIVSDPTEVCGASIPNESDEKASDKNEPDVPKLEAETSLSAVSDFSLVQPNSVTLEVEDDSRLEVEPSSLNACGTQNVKITLQLSSDVKEALLQTEEELRQMASQNKEIVEQHKQFHSSLTLITQSTLQLCDKVQKMVIEKVVTNPEEDTPMEKVEEEKGDSREVERLTNDLKDKDEEILLWKTNCLFLKKVLDMKKDVAELEDVEAKYSSIVAEYTSIELMALGDLMFSDASLNGAALHELNDKIAGLKREFLEVRERHDFEFTYIRDRLNTLKLKNLESSLTSNTDSIHGCVSASTGAIPKTPSYMPLPPKPERLAVLCPQTPPVVPPRRGRDGSVTIEVEERPMFDEPKTSSGSPNISETQIQNSVFLGGVFPENAVVTTSTATATTAVMLTDFGTPVVRQPDPLLCPFCQKEFEADKLEDLETHVEAHLEPNCQCPVCGKIIIIDRITKSREEYEQHVLSHFSEDTNPNPIHDWFMNFE